MQDTIYIVVPGVYFVLSGLVAEDHLRLERHYTTQHIL